MENYENKDRHRCCGLRCGDVVIAWSPYPDRCGVYGVIIGMDKFDNNRVFIKAPNHYTYWHIAEWCEIVTKVEDRGQIHAPAY